MEEVSRRAEQETGGSDNAGIQVQQPLFAEKSDNTEKSLSIKPTEEKGLGIGLLRPGRFIFATVSTLAVTMSVAPEAAHVRTALVEVRLTGRGRPRAARGMCMHVCIVCGTMISSPCSM